MEKKVVNPHDMTDLVALLDSLEDQLEVNPSPTIKEEAKEQEKPAETAKGLADSIDDLAKELGIDLTGVEATIVVPEPAPAAEKKPRKKREAKVKVDEEDKKDVPSNDMEVSPPVGDMDDKEREVTNKETEADIEPKVEKPKLERVQVKMDAPIPVVVYKDIVIGYYGNILEPLAEPDKNGYTWKEAPRAKYHPAEQEAHRSKGRMVLVINTEDGRYLVGVESGETFEGIIEVTNKGRGSLRCRQLAQALGVAYTEKADELAVDKAKYAEYLQKTPEPKLNLGA